MHSATSSNISSTLNIHIESQALQIAKCLGGLSIKRPFEPAFILSSFMMGLEWQERDPKHTRQK
jgi:hypothetical protein